MVNFGKMGGQATAVAAKPSTSFSTAGSSGKKAGVSFLKTGKDAKVAVDEAEAAAELAKAEAGRLWRYMMKEGTDGQITFLDGELDDEGLLDTPVFYDHTIRLNGNWKNFVCTAEEDQTQPCPICETGDKPTLVQVFTIIDHRSHTIQSGQNQGKVIQNTRRLFVAKATTRKLLAKLAAKRGGLTGCTFDVSRTSDKAASVGDQFDFVTKATSYDEIAAKYDLKLEDCQPADYAEEIKYIAPEDLIALGVGKAPSGIGYSKPSNGSFNKADLSDKL